MIDGVEQNGVLKKWLPVVAIIVGLAAVVAFVPARSGRR